MIRDSGSGKTNALLNSINNQPGIGKIYLGKKDTYEAKYRFLIRKRESLDPKAFVEYSNDMEAVSENIEEYNLDKKRKLLIVSDDLIADMINIKELIE